MAIDRQEVSRALAKAIAFKNCGQHEKANVWAIKLIRMLECAEILGDEEHISRAIGAE